MEHIAPVLVMLTLCFLTGWIVWVVSNYKRRTRVEMGQAEMQTKLLDKFGTSEELLAYLQSEAGQRFLQPAPIAVKSPYGRILGSIRWGVILSFLGIAFLIIRGYTPEPEPFLFLGTVILALGLGFLVSSGVAYALSKSWGLFDHGTPRP